MRIVFFGSGEFGLPTLKRLVECHDVAMVVSQPDRPAGRHRQLTPTPIARFAQDERLLVFKPEKPNEPEAVRRVHEICADAYVVIAYGHKIGPALLGETFAINLHASLLPKYRGAAPINWAMIHNEPTTGVSVITLAQRMDAGTILAQRETSIDPLETAGELHDRLAALGPEAVSAVLDQLVSGSIKGVEQDESQATPAPKLSKSDGALQFDAPAEAVRARIHGLTPWPGCAIRIEGKEVKLIRVRNVAERSATAVPGSLSPAGLIACAPDGGSIQILELQPAGGKVMSFSDYSRGHPVEAGSMCEAL
ncbi:MAG TPA: methionyl-tRNA formyltransferase [Phycisphaerales bacterium]|nr:methionyl-tRNA formyltransferase [Phycisphaerales bacterium]HRQ74629.1 methionyl-tRNA formyltransferase [Phycisphaerales bacterium]